MNAVSTVDTIIIHVQLWPGLVCLYVLFLARLAGIPGASRRDPASPGQPACHVNAPQVLCGFVYNPEIPLQAGWPACRLSTSPARTHLYRLVLTFSGAHSPSLSYSPLQARTHLYRLVLTFTGAHSPSQTRTHLYSLFLNIFCTRNHEPREQNREVLHSEFRNDFRLCFSEKSAFRKTVFSVFCIPKI